MSFAIGMAEGDTTRPFCKPSTMMHSSPSLRNLKPRVTTAFPIVIVLSKYASPSRAIHSTPVAFSSMVAKYLREKAMESFNDYFQSLHRGESPLKPTAGYPVDADRFLSAVEQTLRAEEIVTSDLVRSR